MFHCNYSVKHYTSSCKSDITTTFLKTISPQNMIHAKSRGMFAIRPGANHNPYDHSNSTFFYLARVDCIDICKFGKQFYKVYLLTKNRSTTKISHAYKEMVADVLCKPILSTRGIPLSSPLKLLLSLFTRTLLNL